MKRTPKARIAKPKVTRAAMKAELLAKAEATIEQFLDWVEQTDRPNLTQIEDAVLDFRQQLGQAMAETAVNAQPSVTPVPGPPCPQCGREMHSKDNKGKTVTARVGPMKVERSYYYCPHCQAGLFPPR
jgi:formamidopyrimidine-DNA glycosylase